MPRSPFFAPDRMQRSTGAALAILVVAGGACEPGPGPTPQAPRVLVFSRTAGYRHASIEPGIAAIRAIGQAEGFDVDATEDPSAFEPDALNRYAAVVFLSTTEDVLDEAQQQAFTRYIRGGGGFVGVHAASDTEYEWPWYGRLVGAYFAGHPNDPGVREGILHVADADHPSTESLPDPWIRADEWYDFGELQPDLNILLEVDEGSYKRPGENPAPAPRPIAWYHEFDGGRAWYTALGHTSESFTEPAFLDHLRGGLTYIINTR
jgi:type 1 glutamine amidotransferase